MSTIRLQRYLEKLILLFTATVETYFVCSSALARSRCKVPRRLGLRIYE